MLLFLRGFARRPAAWTEPPALPLKKRKRKRIYRITYRVQKAEAVEVSPFERDPFAGYETNRRLREWREEEPLLMHIFGEWLQ